MANVCEFHMIVKGKKNACYAFYEGQNNYEKWIEEEDGTDEEYTMQFFGTCKWSVDQYCGDYSGECPVELPDDLDEAIEFVQEMEVWDYNVESRSRMFSVEVMCNSRDAEGDPEHAYYQHYKNGKPVKSRIPSELEFEGTEEVDYLTAGDAGFDEESMQFEETGVLTTSEGNTFKRDGNRLFFNDVFSVAIPENAEFCVKTPDDDDESQEKYLQISEIFNTTDEDGDDIVKAVFYFSGGHDGLDVHTFVDTDNCNIILSGLAPHMSLSDLLNQNMKVEIFAKITIANQSYFISVIANAVIEAGFVTAIRCLENMLDSIIICDGNQTVTIGRFPNWLISKLHDGFLEATKKGLGALLGSDDDDDDDEDDED